VPPTANPSLLTDLLLFTNHLTSLLLLLLLLQVG
jgi:hypothetical protein